MPGLAVAPNPIANAVLNNAASVNGGANGAASANDASNGDASFSSALQRSMKSNNGDKPAHNDSKPSAKADTENPAQTGTATASNAPATTPAADPLAALLPMLQAKFAQVAQTLEQAGEGKDKAQNVADDDGATAAQDNLMASLAGLLGAQQQASQPTAKTGDELAPKPDAKSDRSTSLAGQAAILATAEEANGQGKKLDKDAGEAGFQTLLDSARNAQQAQHNHEARMAQPANHAETRIETPVGHERWTQEVGDKLSWMVTKQESTATLVLNPPNMGRVEVSVTMTGDQANASFVSANPAVREALENALPRLREVLADAGVQLGQAQVGAESRGDSSQQGEKRDNRGHKNIADGELIPGLASTTTGVGRVQQGNGMVDTFV